MKLQTKFYVGIAIIFAVLAVVIVVITVNYVNTNTIREAEHRVQIYARAAWDIYDAKPEKMRLTLEILAQQKPSLRELLRHPEDARLAQDVRQELEALRQDQGSDMLSLLAPDGTVLLRTRSPYNAGDNLAGDPFVEQVITTRQSSAGTAILDRQRLEVEGPDLIERTLDVAPGARGMLAGAAVPVLDGGEMVGILQTGNLLNGSVDQVDRIRDAVFANEYYEGKPLGTATIFMDDLRISTNVLDDQGRRAVGTRVSSEVAEHVLGQGLFWTGRAFVVDTWYLAQYDPIHDPGGRVIGMLYVGELEQKYLDLRSRSAILYLAVILVGMVLAFAMTFLITRGILGPIRRLSEATRHISAGDLTHRVTVQSKDEIGELAHSFNDMAGQLARQRQEIDHHQQDLEVLNRDLVAINRNYMEMLGFVSHELKNPLTSAIMSLYTVKDGFVGEVNPAQKKSLESVAQSLDYFQDMIKNYLDLSRLEKGELDADKTQFPLHARVIQPVLAGLAQELSARNMVVDNRVPETTIVNADPNLLRIVYNNLLSNAVKYGRQGGAIVLDARQQADDLLLTVHNDSEGIPPDKMDRLFKKFSRLDMPEHFTKRGTGLGLYICKEIIEKHGGLIWVDSQLGEWVRFSFTLPK